MEQNDNDDKSLREGSSLLMATFPPEEVNQKPVPTKRQTEEVKQNPNNGIWCDICGGFHHARARHLDYVGHAAVTRRLLEVDPAWDWDFLVKQDNGAPVFDNENGLWINLTVLGVTRKGYGSADGKKGPNAIKEVIGDAIRNAAMRFGVALELWHKGEFAQSEAFISDSSGKEREPGSVQEEKELPAYKDESLKKRLDKWAEQIKSGGRKAADIIATIESRYTLTDEQKGRILDLEAAEIITNEEDDQ
jgi:hypothetical protein